MSSDLDPAPANMTECMGCRTAAQPKVCSWISKMVQDSLPEVMLKTATSMGVAQVAREAWRPPPARSAWCAGADATDPAHL
jgi:hypothetical protein